jgi:predicted lysophospholipase L1 biosynthesis ABC-type transport system permease subunit
VRAAARHGEIALRVSLGATRWRLVRQCLTENLLLGGLGGIAGTALGLWTSRLLARLLPETTRAWLEPMLWPNVRVMAFAAVVALVTSILFGLLPAIRTTRLESLGSHGLRTIAAMKGMPPLVAAQLALCFVVVAAAALLGRSLMNMERFHPGFDRSQLVTVAIDPFVCHRRRRPGRDYARGPLRPSAVDPSVALRGE